MRDLLGEEFGVGERHRMAGSVVCPVLLCVISRRMVTVSGQILGRFPGLWMAWSCRSRVTEAGQVAWRRGELLVDLHFPATRSSPCADGPAAG